ncbi:MAG: NAD-dependent malic enzyme [Candidatus Hydrogenedentota bacterium]|nr:MAG: NAD-dependent malic enzyme [Candidatus Hydrogenedentota bacterium]
MRIVIPSRPGSFAQVASLIGKAGGDLGAIDLVTVSKEGTIRDVTVAARDEKHAEKIIASVRREKSFDVRSVSDRTFLMHLGGKISVENRHPVKTRDDLSMAYTPGVARVCMAIHEKPRASWSLTIKGNTVAVVSDGSAVLGLGDIGPEAAMPVMEGKAMLFKEFAGVNAFPICLNTHNVDEIVQTVKALAPTFGGINLEDIAAPRCFEIERRLIETLSIPVFHDDQHGTATVVLAALLNAVRLLKLELKKMKVVLSGVGAAGIACSRMMYRAGIRNIIGFDRKGALYRGRTEHMNPEKASFVKFTNPENYRGGMAGALKGAHLFLGLSGPGSVDPAWLKKMAPRAMVFAMANPVPEVYPEEVPRNVKIVATGRSDYPNQINNVLCFPGIFKGALSVYATRINERMKLAAARAIAGTIPPKALSPEYIIPSVFDKTVAERVAKAAAKAAISSGVARRKTTPLTFQ